MAQGLKKSENKTEELKSLSDDLKMLLKIKNAIEKENGKQMGVHARNMVQEVANYHQMSHRLNSMVYFHKEPEHSLVFSVIPTIVESSLTTGNSKKLVRTMDEIEKQIFTAEVVAKFKFSSITKNVPVFMSEDEKVSNLIQTVENEHNLKVSVGLQHFPEPPTIQKKVEYAEVKTSCFNIFGCCASECFLFHYFNCT
ncbi:hypothetical protein MKX03_008923 [Papaver bracteatum]|nr:hypothetical protein MKX03_008923 [Papaver bracteatum]